MGGKPKPKPLSICQKCKGWSYDPCGYCGFKRTHDVFGRPLPSDE